MDTIDIQILGDEIANLAWWEASELYRYLKHAGMQDEFIPAILKPAPNILVGFNVLPKEPCQFVHGVCE